MQAGENDFEFIVKNTLLQINSFNYIIPTTGAPTTEGLKNMLSKLVEAINNEDAEKIAEVLETDEVLKAICEKMKIKANVLWKKSNLFSIDFTFVDADYTINHCALETFVDLFVSVETKEKVSKIIGQKFDDENIVTAIRRKCYVGTYVSQPDYSQEVMNNVMYALSKYKDLMFTKENWLIGISKNYGVLRDILKFYYVNFRYFKHQPDYDIVLKLYDEHKKGRISGEDFWLVLIESMPLDVKRAGFVILEILLHYKEIIDIKFSKALTDKTLMKILVGAYSFAPILIDFSYTILNWISERNEPEDTRFLYEKGLVNYNIAKDELYNKISPMNLISLLYHKQQISSEKIKNEIMKSKKGAIII